jgi:D-psicose/D-tagatose/L-ribulose 3-epimerase
MEIAPWTIGVSTFVWASPLSTDQVSPLFTHIRDLGFEVVELPLEAPEDLDLTVVRRALANTGLRPVVGAVFAPGRELCASDTPTVRSTQDYLRRCIDYSFAIGSELVVGPIYTSVGRCWRSPPSARQRLVQEYQQALEPVAQYAAEARQRLAIEPLNRYETSLFNTVGQLLEAIDVFSSSEVGIAFDTYHANIEEKHPWEALRTCGERLFYVQASGSDRGAPGNDHLDWPAMRAVLADLEYAGPLTVESFTPENETISVAASIWRPLEPSPDTLAKAAITHLSRLRRGDL